MTHETQAVDCPDVCGGLSDPGISFDGAAYCVNPTRLSGNCAVDETAFGGRGTVDVFAPGPV